MNNLNELLKIKSTENMCTAAVIVKNGEILLGNRVYPEKNLSVWNFPGGRCDRGESIREAIIREVFEEIGINESRLKILDFIGNIKGSSKDDIVYLFHCSIEGTPKLMEPEKFKEWKWFKIKDEIKTHFNDDAIKMVKNYFKEKK